MHIITPEYALAPKYYVSALVFREYTFMMTHFGPDADKDYPDGNKDYPDYDTTPLVRL